tara:strand:- start:5213 stop:6106 length:894 start_codon:yes stop_codon:yes gene_type:complete
MTFGISASAAFIGGATLLGGGISYLASQNAADAQQNAAASGVAAQKDIAGQNIAAQQDLTAKNLAAQREMFDIGQANLAPYRKGGNVAQNQLMQMLGIGGDTNAANYGKYARDFGMSDFTADPGYQFRLDQGLKALNASAAARGGALSGANMKGAIDYGQNKASDEYYNAYNRYRTNRADQLAPLQGLYTGGQAAAAGSAAQAGAAGSTMNNAYANLGSNINSTNNALSANVASGINAGGAAAAGAYTAGGAAINSTIGNLGNQYMDMQKAANLTSYQNNVLNALNNQNMSATGYTT